MVHVAKAIHDRWQALTHTRRGHGANDALVVDDLRILENTAVFAGGLLDHFYYHLQEREAGQEYEYHKVTRLFMLRFLPLAPASASAGLPGEGRSGPEGQRAGAIYPMRQQARPARHSGAPVAVDPACGWCGLHSYPARVAAQRLHLDRDGRPRALRPARWRSGNVKK